MWLKFRIIFTIISVVCVAAVIPLGALLGWIWAGVAAVAAFLFYAMMLWCKSHQPTEPEDETSETQNNDTQDNE
jgi:fatty acid desaturase